MTIVLCIDCVIPSNQNMFIFNSQYMSIYKIQYFSTPCLFISGLADTLVPPRMMTQLHAKCGSMRKELLQISGGTHNDTWAVTG